MEQATAVPSISPDDPRLARCGFAKFQGDGIEFFMRKYEVTMGRTSKNSTLDLILGDSTTISRQHASIRYNFDTKTFELVVLGKNGVTVESSGNGTTHLYTPDSGPTQLRSRDLLIMGEKRFYFLLPRPLGGQGRKRRRVEPSPAPAAVHSANPTAAAQAAAPTNLNVQSAALEQQQLPSAPVSSLQQPQQPSASQAAPMVQGDAGVSGPVNAPEPEHAQLAASGTGAPSGLQPHLQQHPQVSQQQQLPEHCHEQQEEVQQPQQQMDLDQDEDDALINAGGAPFDNGVPYGFGVEHDGFTGVGF